MSHADWLAWIETTRTARHEAAGRKAARTTKARYGDDFYRKAGKKGSQVKQQRRAKTAGHV